MTSTPRSHSSSADVASSASSTTSVSSAPGASTEATGVLSPHGHRGPRRGAGGRRGWWLWLLLLGCLLALPMCEPQTPPGESVAEGKDEADAAGETAGEAGSDATPIDQGPPLKAVCAKDIEGDFKKLAVDGKLIIIGQGKLFKGDAEFQYALHAENQLGVQNHFQGVLRWGRHFYASGGDLKIVEGHLLVAALASRPRSGPWGSNVSSPYDAPPAGDVFLEKRNVTKKNHWHAGGMARYGSTLVVPLENNVSSGGEKGSTIIFFDLADPNNPKELSFSIGSEQVAYAVGLTRPTKDGPYLLARWNDKQMVFFTSKTNDISGGFDTDKTADWDVSELKISVKEVGDPGMSGQSVGLLTQCDGAIYMVMNDNTNRLPTKQGTNYLELYKVTFPNGDTRQVPTIEKIGSRAFNCPEQRCNFTAAGGVHVTQDGRLLFYSIPLFRDHEKKQLTVVEFAPE